MSRLALAVVAAMIASRPGAAQTAASAAHWPDRPIHFIVPFAAGSSSDIVARVVAQKLGERLGQPLVVENRPGASGSLGTEAVAHASSDGYTLGLANASTHAVSPGLMTKQAYDPINDFAPISMIGASPFVLALYPNGPVHTVPELIALAKAKPRTLTFASAGPGTLANLAGVLFGEMAKVEITPVYYRGSGQEVFDVIAGRVDMQFGTIPPTLQLIRQGKVRAIAVTGAQRNPPLAEVPTVAESGLPGYEAVLWQAICAPAGTPSAIVTRLNSEVNAILHDSSVIETLAQVGVEAEPSTPQSLAARISADLRKWHDVAVTAGIHEE